MARRPKGRTRFVVKREQQKEKKAANAQLAAGLQEREERDRAVKLKDPTYVAKMTKLDQKITTKRAILIERSKELLDKSTPRLVKMYVNTQDWGWALKGAGVPNDVAVQFIQVLRKKNIRSLPQFKALPSTDFKKFGISTNQITHVEKYITTLMSKYSVHSTERL